MRPDKMREHGTLTGRPLPFHNHYLLEDSHSLPQSEYVAEFDLMAQGTTFRCVMTRMQSTSSCGSCPGRTRCSKPRYPLRGATPSNRPRHCRRPREKQARAIERLRDNSEELFNAAKGEAADPGLLAPRTSSASCSEPAADAAHRATRHSVLAARGPAARPPSLKSSIRQKVPGGWGE